MKILGLISSPSDPASRIRIVQYKDPLAKEGDILSTRFFNPVKDADPAPWVYKLKKITGVNEWRIDNFIKTIGRVPLVFAQTGFDIVWQNRLLQLHHFYWENKINKPVVFDFDDAIWLNEGEKQVARKIESSAMVFAGNEYLAEYAMKYNSNTKVVPTTVDATKLFPLKKKTEHFTIGWIGTKSNFQYLEIIKPAILNFLLQHKDARFHIISSEQPGQFNFHNEQIIFTPWDEASENEMINNFSVGIMPLPDTDWTRGKCSYKMLQYMACGKPVIVSPVGTNKKILETADIGFAATTEKDWLTALNDIYNNETDGTKKGDNGRLIVEKYYSAAILSPVIAAHFKTIIR